MPCLFSSAHRPSGALAVRALVLSICVFFLPLELSGQATATIQGTIVADVDGSPLSDVAVTILVAGTERVMLTDTRGRFQMIDLPGGAYRIVARRIGYAPAEETVEVASGSAAMVTLRLTEQALLIPTVVVSATRETQRLSQTAASVGVISSEELQAAKPTHPANIMSQIPGVWVNVTGGEGHMTAIRQPQTTKPVYLFLEDGVPSRSTGFFNHNALYEINLPQADRVEVLKGPGSALYGSDAIGGVVNVETRRPSLSPSGEAFLERGDFGYNRFLGSLSNSWGDHGVRADVNLTRTDGWREATGYDRQSGTVRWDAYLSPSTSLRTVVTGSRIHQQTAGASALPDTVYATDPTRNQTPISFRDVTAFRASTTAEIRGGQTLLSVTPFVRWNEMEMIPNWSLTYDPTTYTSGHHSFGALVRGRRDFDPLNGRIILGLDLDRSPGSRVEHRIVPIRTDGVFVDFSRAEALYDYAVTFTGISPYLQADADLTDALHLTAGLRYDRMGYSYRTNLEPLATGRWQRPPDADLSYAHLSPKLGLAYDLGPRLNLFGNFTRGFRVPSEGQIFRQGRAASTLDLQPVTADSYELGARGELFGRLGYSVTGYRMTVRNDILGFTLPDGTPETQNAGETLHQGIEVGLGIALLDQLRGDVSFSRADHSYEAWSPRPDVDYAGNAMESAPETTLNARLTFSPNRLEGGRFALEWSRLGPYWLDPENTHRYEGHGLLNLHASVPLPHDLELIGRVMNLTDALYAETASYTAARGVEYAPGLPRTVYLGVQYRWERGR